MSYKNIGSFRAIGIVIIIIWIEILLAFSIYHKFCSSLQFTVIVVRFVDLLLMEVNHLSSLSRILYRRWRIVILQLKSIFSLFFDDRLASWSILGDEISCCRLYQVIWSDWVVYLHSIEEPFSILAWLLWHSSVMLLPIRNANFMVCIIVISIDWSMISVWSLSMHRTILVVCIHNVLKMWACLIESIIRDRCIPVI